jgi:hypothetical protein
MVKKRLTAITLERLKPPPKGQKDIFDQGYHGLALRLSFTGRKTWNLFYRDAASRLHRLKLGMYPVMSLTEAQEAWRLARKEIEAGHDPATKRPSLVFESVMQEWLAKEIKPITAHTAL